MYKIYKKNNYLIIDDEFTAPEEYLTKDVLIREVVANISYDIYGTLPRFGNTEYQLLHNVSIPNIIKEDGSVYAILEWVDFYTTATGLASSNGGSSGGDATAANQVAQTTVLTNILTELKDDVNISETVWYDKITTTLFYVRRSVVNQDTGIITISFYNVDGTVATPIIANLVQVISGIDYEFNSVMRKAIASGVGYSINDKIQELQVINMTAGVIINTIWVNKTTDTLISSPIFTNLVIDDTYANAANQIQGNNSLSSIDAKLPSLVGGKISVTDPITLPLPSNASTSVKQSDGSQKTQVVDGTGNVITSSNIAGKQRLDVTLAGGGVIGATAPTITDQVGGVDGAGNLQPLQLTTGTKLLKQTLNEINGAAVDTNIGNRSAGTQRVVIATDDINLASINAKTPILGNQSAPTSQPVTLSVESSSGTISTQNLVPTGVATVNSSVELLLSGTSGLAIQTVGVYTGALSLQVTVDGTNWVTVGGSPFLNMNTNGLLTTITSALQSTFQTEVGGFIKARITALAAVTGSVVVSIRGVANSPLVNIDSALPTGTNSIGNIGTISTITALGTINTAVVAGVAATHLGKAEDAVATSGDTGVFQLGVRRDSPFVSSSASGDYNEMAVDKYGARLVKDIARHKRTYSASFNLFSIGTATDLFEIKGSATTTVSINKIGFTATQTTGAQIIFSLMKRTAANTGGTFSNASFIPHDSANAAATSVGSIYSAPPVIGGGSNYIRSVSSYVSATATQNNTYTYDFGSSGQPIILNGVAQALALNIGGATMTSGSVFVWIEFTEE
jgi:hypothetical protein